MFIKYTNSLKMKLFNYFSAKLIIIYGKSITKFVLIIIQFLIFFYLPFFESYVLQAVSFFIIKVLIKSMVMKIKFIFFGFK